MTLGEKIKEARKQMGFTQEEMAEKLMVSRPAITKWESDKGIPEVVNLFKIMDHEFYLVEKDNMQYLVAITNEFMEIRRLAEKVETCQGGRFQIGEYIYTNAGPIVYA